MEQWAHMQGIGWRSADPGSQTIVVEDERIGLDSGRYFGLLFVRKRWRSILWMDVWLHFLLPEPLPFLEYRQQISERLS
jgi:hypothetical protein